MDKDFFEDLGRFALASMGVFVGVLFLSLCFFWVVATTGSFGVILLALVVGAIVLSAAAGVLVTVLSVVWAVIAPVVRWVRRWAKRKD